MGISYLSRLILHINLALLMVCGFNLSLRGQLYLPQNLTSKINQLKRESRFDEAIIVLDSLIASRPSALTQNAKFEAAILKADIFRLKGWNDLSLRQADSLFIINSGDFRNFPELRAQLFTLKGTIFLIKGQLANGKRNIDSAICIYSSKYGSEDTILGPCYNKLGNYYYFSKQYDSALVYYSLALKLAEKRRDNMEDKSSYLQNIGIVYLQLCNFSSAEISFQKSLKLKESLYNPKSYSLGRIYLNFGRFYQGISELEKSLVYLDNAETIFTSDSKTPTFELGSIYWNKGLIYYLMGENEMALTYLFNARPIIETVFADNKKLLSSLNSDIGNVYRSLGQYEKAVDYYELSMATGDALSNLKTIRNMANLFYLDGELQKAGYYFKDLMESSKELGLKDNPDMGLTYLRYGDYLIRKNNDSALIYLEKSYSIYSSNLGFHNKDVASVLLSIACYNGIRGHLYPALQFCQKSLLSYAESFEDTNVLVNPPVESLKPDNLLINILADKSKYLRQYYNKTGDIEYLLSSCRTYLLCSELADLQRLKYKTELSRFRLAEDINKIYLQAIEQFLETYTITGNTDWLYSAFQISEKGKSMVLLNEFRDANAKKLGLVPEEINDLEMEIKSKICLYQNQIEELETLPDADNKKLNYYRSSQLEYEQKYDSLISQLKKNYPDYYKLKYDHNVISVDKLQEILDKDEVILEYTLADDFVYIFMISRDEFKVEKFQIDSTMTKSIFALKRNLDFDHVYEYSYSDFIDYQQLAYSIYKVLVQPFESFLDDKKLIIIPDAELNFLSFESLIQRMVITDTIDFRHLPYLLRKCPISYSASSTFLSLIKKGPTPVLKHGVLALAPSFDILSCKFLAQNEALLPYLQSKNELPGAAWEAENVLKMMKGKELIGEKATEAEFKKLAESYDILHFATHTWIDDINPLSSTLALYPFDISEEDGLLHTYEVYNLHLKGELAVLSACSTGDGKLQKGEGVMSLARAFTYAGMPSVIMTLWDVDDISSGNIIPVFYDILRKGYDKDVALQWAKLDYLEQTKAEIETHPIFWSGIVLYGNSRGFRLPITKFYIICLVVLCCLFTFVSIIVVRKYRNFRKEIKPDDIDLPNEFRTEDRI